jgi:hypothetical protein
MRGRTWWTLVLPRSRRNTTARLALLVVLLLVAYPSLAQAYVDFGLGSYAFQILLAWALGLAFALRAFWTRIVAFLRKFFGR